MELKDLREENKVLTSECDRLIKKIYKCMTCKYFKVERLSMGLLWQECEYDKMQKSKFKRWHRLEPRQDDAFKMKT